jgi:hypothetical protein
MQLNRVGRLEGRARRAPSGKRDFVSHFVVVSRELRIEESLRVESRREEKSRDLVTGRAQEHLVQTGIFHFNINRSSFSCMYSVLNECL